MKGGNLSLCITQRERERERCGGENGWDGRTEDMKNSGMLERQRVTEMKGSVCLVYSMRVHAMGELQQPPLHNATTWQGVSITGGTSRFNGDRIVHNVAFDCGN